MKTLNINEICQLLFESATEGIVVTDAKGIIHVANPGAEEMFGYETGELIGKEVEILIPQAYRSKHVNHRKSYNSSPSKRSMGIGLDLTGLKKDHTEIPVEISLNHFKANGDTLVMALINDITLRKEAHDQIRKLNLELEERVEKRTTELKQSQQLYSTIARNFPNGTINVFDKNLNYVFAEGVELFKMGITSEKLIGTSYLKRLDPVLRNDIQAELMQVFKGKNSQFEIEFNGNAYLIHAVGLHDLAGDIHEILVVEQNITEQKQAEKKIRQALEKEQQLSELKSRFVSMASHEFRTPLSTILSSVSLIARYNNPADEEKRNKHIGRIKSSVRNLTGILNDFLSLDKLEAGKINIQSALVNLTKFFQEEVEEMAALTGKGQSIRHTHEGKNEAVIDPNIFKNILNNLLSNALKYSPEGSEIKLHTYAEKSTLKIAVEDNGIGIPLEEQNHLFERFFRAKNATNISGTGLGLHIVNKYVELMGGNIHFESEPGKGTTFVVEIPEQEV